MARKSKIAIVLLSYNALGYARRMLRSVRQTTGVDFERQRIDCGRIRGRSGLPWEREI